MANIRELTGNNFDETIKNGKVLVDFWATWCGPCRMQTPVLEKLSKEMKNVTFAKVNVDEQTALQQRYGVMSIPTLLIFNNGQLERTLIGYHGESQVKAALT